MNPINSIKNLFSPAVTTKPVGSETNVTQSDRTPGQQALRDQLDAGMANKIPLEEDKWVPAKGPSAFSQIFKMPQCIKNTMSCIASIFEKGLKPKSEVDKTSNQGQSYLEKPLSKNGEEVLSNIKKYGFSDGLEKLSNDEKLKIIHESAAGVNLSDPHDNILHQLLDNKSELGKAFETVSKNSQLSENLEFIKNCRSYQKDKNPETLKALQDNIGKMNLLPNNPSHSKAINALNEGKVEGALKEITNLLIREISSTHAGKLTLEKKEMKIDEALTQKVKDMSFDGGSGDLEGLFKKK